jgi:GNAT superfamily N-acetyltransferase
MPETGEPAPTAPPPGYVLVTVRTTSLQMLASSVPVRPDAPPGCRVQRWRRPKPAAYRRLFEAVGGPWGWTGHLLLGDEELGALLTDERLELWRLRAGSIVAGFVELDRRVSGETEILYFGLAPEFIGRGLGSFLLRWAIHHTWTTPPGRRGTGEATRRLWLHTCDYDHPGALAVYRRAGFEVFEEHVGPELYPADHIARLKPHR